MPHRPEKLLIDVQDAIARIEEFTAGISHEEFALDQLRRSAVQMQFIIIGEALTRLRRDHPEVFDQITKSERIVSFRNYIAHGYDTIADDVVWDVITNHLGVLKADVIRLNSASS